MENNQIHLLVVDDDNRIRDLLKDYLNSKNFLVSTAVNAEEAKKKLRSEQNPLIDRLLNHLRDKA